MSQAVLERAESRPASRRATSVRRSDSSSTLAAIHQFLSFKLGLEEYGLDIQRVREIRSYEQPTRIANAPAHVKGVINLRGVIVPIVDLRLKFGLTNPDYDATTVAIVVDTGAQVIGLVVDGVSDVLRFDADQLRPSPDVGASGCTAHLLGIGCIDSRLLQLIDVVALLASVDMGLTE